MSTCKLDFDESKQERKKKISTEISECENSQSNIYNRNSDSQRTTNANNSRKPSDFRYFRSIYYCLNLLVICLRRTILKVGSKNLDHTSKYLLNELKPFSSHALFIVNLGMPNGKLTFNWSIIKREKQKIKEKLFRYGGIIFVFVDYFKESKIFQNTVWSRKSL